MEVPNVTGAPSDEAFARYLSNESTSAERATIEAWMAQEPARGAMLSQMAAIWDEPRFGLDVWDSAMLSARMQARRSEATQAVPRSPKPRFTDHRSMWWMVAGVGLAVTLVGGGILADHLNTPPTTMAATTSWQFRTTRAQRAEVTLADGSRIVLGVSSRLTPAPSFGTTSREVYLDGEAYFDVSPNTALPFIVRTGTIATRVLGTTFTVRKYADESETQVAVASGRVAVRHVSDHVAGDTADILDPHDETGAVLSAGDIGRINANGRSVIVQDSSAVAELSARRLGWLNLNRVALRDAVDDLARWYDLDIRIADSGLAYRTITASFHNEQPQAVMQYVADALGARVEQRGRQVTFFRR